MTGPKPVGNLKNTPMGAERAAVLYHRLSGYFPAPNASDVEVLMAGSVELLSGYPEWVGERLCSVHTGLPAKHDFMPAIKPLREACEEEYRITRQVIEWEKQAQMLPKPDTPRPSLQELQDKFGPAWGLQSMTEAEEHAREKNLGNIQKANQKLWKSQDIKPGGISEELRKKITGDRRDIE